MFGGGQIIDDLPLFAAVIVQVEDQIIDVALGRRQPFAFLEPLVPEPRLERVGEHVDLAAVGQMRDERVRGGDLGVRGNEPEGGLATARFPAAEQVELRPDQAKLLAQREAAQGVVKIQGEQEDDQRAGVEGRSVPQALLLEQIEPFDQAEKDGRRLDIVIMITDRAEITVAAQNIKRDGREEDEQQSRAEQRQKGGRGQQVPVIAEAGRL